MSEQKNRCLQSKAFPEDLKLGLINSGSTLFWWSEPKHIVSLDQMEFSRFGVPAVKHGGEGGLCSTKSHIMKIIIKKYRNFSSFTVFFVLFYTQCIKFEFYLQH